MNPKKYFGKMKNIEDELLNFLDHGDHLEENFENFLKVLTKQNILKDKHDLKIILYLIVNIANNHHRYENFYSKIDQILIKIKDEIKRYYSNNEIFNIFKKNKRILLFLIEEQILKFDQKIYQKIMNNKYKQKKYPEYFSPEIKTFVEKEIKSNKNQKYCDSNLYDQIQVILKEDYSKFNEKRKNGENDDYLSKIIQNDSIEEFIIYVNKKDYPLSSCIDISIYDTNEFLLDQDETYLIEYAAFYGSSQIFKYIYKNDYQITTDLWYYAIHGYDEEIIHFLEEEDIMPNNEECFKESIKCHHNYITNYIERNLKERKNKYIISYGIQYYNFIYIMDYYKYADIFIEACKFDYYKIVEYIISKKEISISDRYDDILYYFY